MVEDTDHQDDPHSEVADVHQDEVRWDEGVLQDDVVVGLLDDLRVDLQELLVEGALLDLEGDQLGQMGDPWVPADDSQVAQVDGLQVPVVVDEILQGLMMLEVPMEQVQVPALS